MAAVRRVVALASVWPFATSEEGWVSIRRERRGEVGGKGREGSEVPLLPSFEAPDNTLWALSLAWLTVFLGDGGSVRLQWRGRQAGVWWGRVLT